MERKNLLLVGAGGHARSCINIIEQFDEYNIVGLIGLPEQLNTSVSGYRVIGTDSDLSLFINKYQYAFVTVGQIKSSETRSLLFKKINQIGFSVPLIISKLAYVAPDAVINQGTIVMHGVIINSGSKIGSNCIINTNALIEHDVNVGNSVHVSTGAIINGSAVVGDNTFLGSGSIVKQGIKIGNECFVGMGTRVIRDLVNGEKLVTE